MARTVLMPEALKLLIMRCLFLKQPAPDFWLGLSTRLFEIPPTLATLGESEPVNAPGYSRVQVKEWSLTTNPVGINSDEAQFRNIGEDRWPRIQQWFLATSVDDSGILVAHSDLQESRVLVPRDILVVPINIHF